MMVNSSSLLDKALSLLELYICGKMTQVSELGIYEVVSELKKEIKRLADDRAEDPIFRIAKATVQLSMVVDKEGEAGIKFWVVNAGGTVKKENVHTITLELTTLKDTFALR